MSFQVSDLLLQLFLSSGIITQRLGLEGWIQFIPDGIHLALEVAGVGGDGDHGIFVRNHDAELAVGAVTAKSFMRAAPELKAITLLGRYCIGNACRAGAERDGLKLFHRRCSADGLGLGVMAAGHGEQVPHLHGLEALSFPAASQPYAARKRRSAGSFAERGGNQVPTRVRFHQAPLGSPGGANS